MYTKGLHLNELQALVVASERFGGFNKICPCDKCGIVFDKKSITTIRFSVSSVVKKSYLWYNDTKTGSTHIEEVKNV